MPSVIMICRRWVVGAVGVVGGDRRDRAGKPHSAARALRGLGTGMRLADGRRRCVATCRIRSVSADGVFTAHRNTSP